MKKVLLAAAALAAAAGVANADVTYNLGSAALAGFQSVGGTTSGLTGTLTGIAISYDFQPDATAQGNGSWASDVLVVIGGDNGELVQWGGYFANYPGAFNEGLWTYDGAGSAAPGIYTDTKAVTDATPPAGAGGTWTVLFYNGWSGSTPVQYNNISITLHGVTIPAPGAAAVLGLGGLLVSRRRR